MALNRAKSGNEIPSSFNTLLAGRKLALTRKNTTALQVNTGLLCNQVCRHCHLEAGPGRTEAMDGKTAAEVVDYAAGCGFEIADITGGAPELNPNLPFLIEGLAPQVKRLILRANLTALGDKWDDLSPLLVKHNAAVAASLPAVNPSQVDSMRGPDVFERSLDILKRLNDIGYGQAGSALELNLAVNPAGAFMPPDQSQAEARFRDQLKRKWGIVFNRLFSFANVPLGRFRKWLIDSGNLDSYVKTLSDGFNPCSLEGLMCRSQMSVSWDGYLYDCDFNLAAGLPLGGAKIHVRDMKGPPAAGSLIVSGDHCFTCTAGAGFT